MHITTIFRLFLLPLAVLTATWAPAQSVMESRPFFAAPQPKHEMRAVWLTTIGGLDWPHSYAQSAYSIERQKAELRQQLDQYQRMGLNTILIQTRIRATTIYPSPWEPWDGCLSGHPGKSPGYDALAFAVDECHARGMAIEAWVVTIPVGRWTARGCTDLRRRYPGLVKKIGNEGYMTPSDPRTATHLAQVCRDLAERYDLDGIHLDYLRYPEQWAGTTSSRGLAARQSHITAIMQAIHKAVRRVKPWVRLSCSPIGKSDDLPRKWSHGWNARTRVAQDAQEWLRTGLVDELMPMMYFRGDQFTPFAIDWAEQRGDGHVAAGLGIYFLSPKEGRWTLSDVEGQLALCRQNGLGQTYFRGKFLTDNTRGIGDYLADHFYAYPSLLPPMASAPAEQPLAPQGLKVVRSWDYAHLSWSYTEPAYMAAMPKNVGHVTFCVYASDSYPVDVTRAENLVASHVSDLRAVLPVGGKGRQYYAVTALDRYGRESPAATEQLATARKLPTPRDTSLGKRRR